MIEANNDGNGSRPAARKEMVMVPREGYGDKPAEVEGTVLLNISKDSNGSRQQRWQEMVMGASQQWWKELVMVAGQQ